MWLGYFGAGDPLIIRKVLGPGSNIHAADNYAVGVCRCAALKIGACETLVSTPGAVKAFIGDDVSAGCSVQVDPEGPTVQLRRDRFGLRSVYYAESPNGLWFSSSLSALIACLPQHPALNLTGLHGYLVFSYVPNPETMFTGVCALPAGHTLVSSNRGIRITPPESWAAVQNTDDEESAAIELRNLLLAAVHSRLAQSNRIGAFLSGGLDSSLIAAMLAECGVRPKLYSLDFGPIANDGDLSCARLVAQHLGCDLTVVQADANSVRKALPRMGKAFDQPFGDGALLPLLLLGDAAAQEVDVVFNGEGGDQLFGGWANKPMIAAELYGGPQTSGSRESIYLQTFHRFLESTHRLYTPSTQRSTCAIMAEDWVRSALREGGYGSFLHQLRAANLALKGAQNIAPRSTQAAEACGLQVQSPFFDIALAQWTFGLAPDMLLHGSCEKYLLKRVAQQYLPETVVWREKRGMGVPTTEWCVGALKRDAACILNRRDIVSDGFFDLQFVNELLTGVDLPGEYRRRRIGEKLWTLLMFQIWRKEHITS